MPYTSHGYWFGPAAPPQPPRLRARCGGLNICATCRDEMQQQLARLPRRFQLWREVAVSAKVRTARVADGVVWPDGTATVRWRTEPPSTVQWSSVTDIEAELACARGGLPLTRLMWVDDAEGPT